MPPAPTVQSLSDIVAGIQAAQAPENAQIDSSIASNETSGQAQTAGLNAAKTQAFGGIEQAASNKGMFFSGFTPDAEAKYTGSTYLPALAKLQSTIAATRDSLLGSKAKLATDANTAGLSVRQGQQDKLDAYNNAVIAAQAKAQSDELARQNALQVAQVRANATLYNNVPSSQDIINYYINADSNYGAYNPNGTNYHRWQAAADDLKAHGYDVGSGSALDKTLQSTFGGK